MVDRVKLDIVELLHFLHFYHVSLVQWTICLLPATGGSGLRPGGATHTLELGLPVSYVSLHWWPQRDPWSPTMTSPMTWATGCFSHPSCPSSILTAAHRLMRHTVRTPSGPYPLLKRDPCGAPAFPTLSQCLTGPQGGNGSRPGAATRTLEMGLPVSDVLLQ